MKKNNIKRRCFICLAGFLCLVAALLLLNKFSNFSPWIKGGSIVLPSYAAGNDNRLAVVENSGKSVIVLNCSGTAIYRIKAKQNSKKTFSKAINAALDEENNLYILDAVFNGVNEENTERILKYSAAGNFLGEVYKYSYTNEDFLITKGKIAGFSAANGSVFIARLENDGFYLEKANAGAYSEPGIMLIYKYPNALRDLAFFHINQEAECLTLTTKAGGIMQISFNGAVLKKIAPRHNALPWSAASNESYDIFYSDIVNNEIKKFSTDGGELSFLSDGSDSESPYFIINYSGKKLFAASSDNVFVSSEGNNVTFNSYLFSDNEILLRYIWFCLFILAAFFLFGFLFFSLVLLSKIKHGATFKTIIFAAFCIIFGAFVASIMIINQIRKIYYAQTYDNLENVSRLIAEDIDADFISSLSSPEQYDSAEYLNFKEKIKGLTKQLSLDGKSVYQVILIESDGIVYLMYDLESSAGLFYNMGDYAGSFYEHISETKKFEHYEQIITEGRFFFITGPVFDKNGNVAAFIETGYAFNIFEKELRNLIVQISLMVLSATIAFIFIIIEAIVTIAAYKANKTLLLKNRSPVFRPEFPRILTFLTFFAASVASAILPIYAAKLYMPLFNLPREFIITLPNTADVVFAAIALIIVPNILEFTGIKTISVISAVMLIAGNIMCVIAPNILLLSIAYAIDGFAIGAIMLVINTIIGAQKNENEINEGFAHYNSAYLSGKNTGIIFGAIIAQFFPYRAMFIVSSLVAVLLFFVILVSLKAKSMKFIYKVKYQKERGKGNFSLVRFVFKPVVLASLFLLLFPYMVSLGFSEYFVSIFGIENGLSESNVGQLVLLSGLFAVLFGAPLCKIALEKFKIMTILIFALVLNLAAILVFSIKPSVPLLIISILMLSMANVFALTNIQTFYADLYIKEKVSSMKALSVYSAVENISLMVGPIVFSYILSSGNMAVSLKLFSMAMLMALSLFVIAASGAGFNNKTSLK